MSFLGRHAAWLLAATLLGGCASVGHKAPVGTETISGKLSVRVDASTTAPARSESGNFELKGTPADGQLNLSSPLGTVLAQARWSGQRAWLTTSQGEIAYPDLDARRAGLSAAGLVSRPGSLF